jgi:hypothetical protein
MKEKTENEMLKKLAEAEISIELKQELLKKLTENKNSNYQNEDILNDGWIKATDDGNKRNFWYNTITKDVLEKECLSTALYGVENIKRHWINAIQYKIIFNPLKEYGAYNENNFYYWNTYEGIKCDRIEGDASLFEYHIKHIWANDNYELGEYFLNWLAHLIQRPYKKIGTALVIGGKSGTGKTIIINKIIEIFNTKYCSVITNNYAVNNIFNGWMRNKLLVNFNEIEMNEKDMEGNLKGWITDNIITWHIKNKTEFDGINYANFIFTTNANLMIKIKDDNRRYVITRTAEKESTDYYTSLADVPAGIVYDYLLKRDISNFIPFIFPHTDYEKEQLKLNYSNVEQYIEDGFLEFLPKGNSNGWITRKEVLDSYKEFSGNKNVRPQTFWQEMRNKDVIEDEKLISGYYKVKIKKNTDANE